jgi:hypothetical protein
MGLLDWAIVIVISWIVGSLVGGFAYGAIKEIYQRRNRR